jgi:HK97 family phage prohead protease
MALVHEKVGHTEQGLWHHKGMQLPAFIQHIANELIRQRGMDESEAIATAISQCKRWAAGGEGVKPETRAKAAAAIAEWEALKAKSGGKEHGRTGRVTTYTRSFPLEDIKIRAGGDGRTVEAYAAIFDSPAPIHDEDGTYEEVIDPAAFDRAIEHARRADGWSIPVLFNHGLSAWKTPSDRYSMPIGVPEEIRADRRGLFTRTRYHDTPLAHEVLETIREGSIRAYSFQGAFTRSQPTVPRGLFKPDRDGSLRTVRRMESTLREYGPTPFPAYAGAEVVGVRAESLAAQILVMDAGERQQLATLLASGTPSDPPDDDTAVAASAAAGAEDPPQLRHSGRPPREELIAQRAAFLIRHGGGRGA